MQIIYDIITDLAWGDTGKGKFTNEYIKLRNYTHCVRYSGGPNCGHTIWEKGKKIVTHSVPSGFIHKVKSIVGPGCVVDPIAFLEELEEHEKLGYNTKDLIFVAGNAHVITKEHKEEDQKDITIGTTKRGVGPAYRNKYNRTGIRAQDVPELKEFIIDFYEEIFVKSGDKTLLFEGAQGFGLDIDHGNYPYVTSSHCTVGSAIMNGVPPKGLRDTIGIAKVYDTYVGGKQFEPNEEIFKQIREIGEEYGATTGRARQCNWLNLDSLIKAININGSNILYLNKLDVLDKVGRWAVIDNNVVMNFSNSFGFQNYVREQIKERSYSRVNLHFSSNKETM